MYRHILISAASLAITCTASQAATQFDFTQLFVGGVAYNFANNGAATGTNDLTWGIISDANGDGFDTGAYTGGFSITTDSAATSLSTNSGISDDILYVGSSLSGDSTFAGGGAGTLFNTTLTIDASNSSDSFGLIWFDSNDISGAGSVLVGDNYGFFTDASFVLPSTDGGSLPYDAIFTGVQSLRTANLSFVAASAVPEPSSTALLGLGSVALLLRRRR